MQKSENIPWVEKYRPKDISDILEQNEIILPQQSLVVHRKEILIQSLK